MTPARRRAGRRSPARRRAGRCHAAIRRSDPLWYKDAIIYQLHVKAFFDANDDGIGDFPGLTRKLDYLQDLGVTALWLLPFYPSPLRDDGYDIADYRNINPCYGTMADFRRFVREAHRRGLRVITELVINHTSDQHPWFQRARARQARLALARLLCVERHRPEIRRHPHHLPRHREIELGVGPGGAGLLLAPLLRAPARPQFRQSAGVPRGRQRHEVLARSRGRRHAARRGALSHRARRHDQREPARDP